MLWSYTKMNTSSFRKKMALISVSLGTDIVGGTTDWWNECKEMKFSLLKVKLKSMEVDKPGSNGLTIIYLSHRSWRAFQEKPANWELVPYEHQIVNVLPKHLHCQKGKKGLKQLTGPLVWTQWHNILENKFYGNRIIESFRLKRTFHVNQVNQQSQFHL